MREHRIRTDACYSRADQIPPDDFLTIAKAFSVMGKIAWTESASSCGTHRQGAWALEISGELLPGTLLCGERQSCGGHDQRSWERARPARQDQKIMLHGCYLANSAGETPALPGICPKGMPAVGPDL